MSLTVISLIFLTAGVIKGLFGLGLPAVSMGLLGLIITPVEAASLLVLPTLATNLWQSLAGKHFFDLWARLKALLLMICIGTAAGVHFLIGESAEFTTFALGAVLTLYAVVGLTSAKLHVSQRNERWLSPLTGLFTGAISGATGIAVMPLVPYLNSLGLHKNELIQAMGLCFTIAIIALGVGLGFSGHLESGKLQTSALALLPVFAGMFIGQRIRRRLSAADFSRWFFAGLLLLGLYTTLRALQL